MMFRGGALQVDQVVTSWYGTGMRASLLERGAIMALSSLSNPGIASIQRWVIRPFMIR